MTASVTVDTPELFGPYRIEELLGRGGMGEVYRAYDTVHGRQVALKCLAPPAGPEFQNRFRREARIAAQLRAPHVVPIHAHGEIDGRLYLDMRLIDGPDLKRLLADGPLGPARTVEILSQVASALDAAHAQGVLHRDVKPANILLDADGTAYLADFGIARLFAADVTRLTRTSDTVGTLDYMAPERLTQSEAGPASDVYSLACVLFQCLTGRVPFPAADSVGKLTAQLNDPPPAASLFDRRIPPAMDLVVQTGMDKDPRRRYPSAGELMAAAAAAMVTAGPQASTVLAVPDAGDPGRSYFVRLLASVGGGERTASMPRGHDAALSDGEGGEAVREQCPYPGLRSFGAGDGDWFFGREQAVRDLLARLSRQRADAGPLLVTGASGAGKSSLLHAGLLTAHARASAPAPQLAMTPGEHPIATLAARLAPLTRTDPGTLAHRLREQPAVCGELCRAIAAEARSPLIILVDQAEELFTHCADVGEREAFATALANAWPARVVLVMRADFIEHCIGLAALKPSLQAPFVLGPLTADELAQVITKPAEAAGLELEPGLVDRLITDVGDSEDPGALPRLAHALRETWHNRTGNRLTLTGYQRTGGVERAVALTADGVYARLGEQDRHALRAALLRMVVLLDGGGIARRWARRADVPERVLESLISARLVTIDQDHLRLSHDALLTAWPRLRQWVAEDRQGLLVRQQLDEAAAGWREGGRDRADLYRGARLAAALDWAAGRTDVTTDEQAFLSAGERERRRRTRRLQGLVAVLATLLAAALTAGTLAVISRNDAEGARRDALSRQLAAESLSEAKVDPVDAMRKAAQAWRTSQTSEARGALLSAPMITYPSAFSSGLRNVDAIDVNPDGSLVAIGSSDGRVALWDVAHRRPLDSSVTAGGSVEAVRFSPDGTLLAVSTLGDNATDSGVRIWDVASGRLVAQLAAGSSLAVGAIAWRPDGQAVAAQLLQASGLAGIYEWNPWTGGQMRMVAGADGAGVVLSLTYSAADRLALGSADGSVELWDTGAVTRISRHTDHADNAQTHQAGDPISVQVASSGALIASASPLDPMIRLWDGRTGAAVRAFPDLIGGGTGPTSLAFSPSGDTLYTTSGANSIAEWDPKNGAYLSSLVQGPRGGTSTGKPPFALAVSRDGHTRVAVDIDGTVLRWHTNSNWLPGPTAAVTSLAFAPGGRTVSAGDFDGALYSWNAATGKLDSGTAVATGTSGGVQEIAYTPDGTLITGTGDGTFTASPSGTGSGTPRSVTLLVRAFFGSGAMAVSPDGRWLAAADGQSTSTDQSDFKIEVWDTATLAEHASLDLGTQQAVALAFSPDGGRLLALTNSTAGGPAGSTAPGAAATSMITWRVPDFTGGKPIALGADTLDAVVYTPDGRSVITAGTTGVLQIRDAATGRLREQFGSHPSRVRRLAISPDGRTLASITAEDSTIRLWNLADPGHELVATLNGHLGPLNDIAFSPDGSRLASGGTDTDVALWRLDPIDALREVCGNLADATPQDLDGTGCS